MNPVLRTFIEMGLAGVVATQLWHHLFIDPTLADIPASPWARRPALKLAGVNGRTSPAPVY